MSPRRNVKGYSRRRTARRPEPEQDTTAVTWDALALDLVRRGLANASILNGPGILPYRQRESRP